MNKIRTILVIYILLAANSALSDTFVRLANYKCSEETNILSITHKGAWNQDGMNLATNAGIDDWTPMDLIKIKDEKRGTYVIGVLSETRYCLLSDGMYKFVISGKPGNGNLLGRCGATATFSISIDREGKNIYSGNLEGDCLENDPVIISITIEPEKPPQVKEVPKKEFYAF